MGVNSPASNLRTRANNKMLWGPFERSTRCGAFLTFIKLKIVTFLFLPVERFSEVPGSRFAARIRLHFFPAPTGLNGAENAD